MPAMRLLLRRDQPRGRDQAALVRYEQVSEVCFRQFRPAAALVGGLVTSTRYSQAVSEGRMAHDRATHLSRFGIRLRS